VLNPGLKLRQWVTNFFTLFRLKRNYVGPDFRTNVMSVHISDIRLYFKNVFKTVLGRSGAKKNSFLCFGHITWPFMVRFRLNLGLNNLKFVHKSISAVESIRSIRFDPIDSIRSIRSDRFNLTAEMDLWTNFKLFRPKLSLNRTINGHFQCMMEVNSYVDYVGYFSLETRKPYLSRWNRFT
jgi:hypothetical protein